MTPKIWNSFVPQFDMLPSVNQLECNPFAQQKDIRKIMAQGDVKVMCWDSLGQGNKDLLTNETIKAIGEKYGKNIGQVILRFETQDDMITLPKSTNPIFNFTLNEDEMYAIRALDANKPSHDPDAPGVGDYLIKNYPIED